MATAVRTTRTASTRSAAPFRTAALAAAAGVADVGFNPTGRHIPLCPLHALTGWQCPFCGSLRAGAELARAHLTTALHDNALLVLSLPIMIALWWASVVRKQPARSWPRVVRVTVVGVVVAFAVIRNLPAMGFLRPA